MQTQVGNSQIKNRISPKRSGIKRAVPLIATRTQTGNGSFGSSSNAAPSKSAEKVKSVPSTVRKSSSSFVTIPVSVIPNGGSEINIRTFVISCFHAVNKAIARSRWLALDEDECMFLLCVREFGFERATVLGGWRRVPMGCRTRRFCGCGFRPHCNSGENQSRILSLTNDYSYCIVALGYKRVPFPYRRHLVGVLLSGPY
jgi:hypothetical protein